MLPSGYEVVEEFRDGTLHIRPVGDTYCQQFIKELPDGRFLFWDAEAFQERNEFPLEIFGVTIYAMVYASRKEWEEENV